MNEKNVYTQKMLKQKSGDMDSDYITKIMMTPYTQ